MGQIPLVTIYLTGIAALFFLISLGHIADGFYTLLQMADVVDNRKEHLINISKRRARRAVAAFEWGFSFLLMALVSFLFS